jgi:hypothetical protein
MPPPPGAGRPDREEAGGTRERKNPLPGGNEPFTCIRCGASVKPLRNGSIRNHCPECLWSLHVDRVPGDRSEACRGPMRPIGIEGSSGAGWTILFRCERCGAERRNRAAEDDPEAPDRWERLIELSSRGGDRDPRKAGGRHRRR